MFYGAHTAHLETSQVLSSRLDTLVLLNWLLIVRIRVPTCCVNIENRVFHLTFLAWNENVACSTTMQSMQSCCAMSNSIWCEKTHIKNMIFDVHTARRDTYPYNEQSIQWAEMVSVLRHPSGMTSNIEFQTFKYGAQNLQTPSSTYGAPNMQTRMKTVVITNWSDWFSGKY